MSNLVNPASQPHRQNETGGQLSAQWLEYLTWLFAYQGLAIRQKLLAISQKYYVNDDQGVPRFFVVRPPKLAMNFVAGIFAFLIWLMFLYFAFQMFVSSGQFIFPLVIVFTGKYLSRIVKTLLTPYRDIRVFTDDSQQYQVLFISQDNKFGFFHWFSIYDIQGDLVARAKRNLFFSLWRRRWAAVTGNESQLLVVREDSLPLAILRRYLGPMWGLLRTNFDFILPNGTRIGEYNRKLTLTDQYHLDLTQDPWFLVDRRVALALAILLDTAEGR